MEPYVSLVKALAWPVLIAGVLVAYRRPIGRFGAKVEKEVGRRLEAGSGVKVSAGPFAAELTELPRFEPQAPQSAPSTEAPEAPHHVDSLPPPGAPGEAAEWAEYRSQLKRRSRNIHLVHVISPSKVPGQRFDIFAYLVPSRGGDLSDVVRAQFFLGQYWGNKIFDVPNEGAGKPIGFSTSAYGTPLCVCRVFFRDGGSAILSRLLDFEMQSVFEQRSTS
ncbi:hypothetical protein PUR71_20205 [Streptomyces sp. SP17BM10]|uniref:pYEATS domain-containing protein n=1 Tax=Streptomyces sp. SP17BM10 TaxID=3002530 RepID=UPI002E79A029|nr:pYEATS domain-containing protein [Streptomyces sp. SP17BM10]MEE1785214.1 hypothetical protein [Streptomyces sp. SP17BM10]